MAPKRKADEIVNAVITMQAAASHNQDVDRVASGTLAGASGQSVDTLLDRVGNKRLRALAAKGIAGNTSKAFPLPKARAVAEAVCGAAAQQQAASTEQSEAQQDDKEAVPGSASEWEWEDADDVDDEWETAEPDQAVSAAGAVGSFDVEEEEAEAVPGKKRRKGITKEQKELARLLHRTHLLCLLARGLLYDQAASDAMLQATMLSLANPKVLPPWHPSKGVSPASLKPLMHWFRRSFQLLPTTSQQNGSEAEDLTVPSDGLATVLEQLQAAAVTKQGSAEQLQVLFVALCRAHGMLVRSVRVLNPMPLHPGVRRPPAHLKQSRESNTKLEPEASNDAASFHESVTQASATQDSAAQSSAAPAKKARKRQADTALPESSSAAPGSTSQAAATALNAPSSSKKGGKPRKAAGKVPESSKGAKEGQPNKRNSKGRKRKSKATEEDEEAEQQLQDDIAAVCAASLSEAQRQPQQGGEEPPKAKRVGDIELENQLAMALASTAAEAEHRARHKPAATQVHNQASLPQASTHAKPTLGEAWTRSSGLAAQSVEADEGAAQWAEVYCNSAEQGKWVHVDPLLDWLDSPDRVEGSAVRPGGLAYVVAFANSGAKDVTQRYVASVLAADKLRDNAWWDETLKPLRKHEVAATTMHHKAWQQQQLAGSAHTSTSVQPVAAAPSSNKQGGTASAVHSKVAEIAVKREDEELHQKRAVERRCLPSNVDGFKHHPVYVLERHIGRYFALKPGTVRAGMHRGEAFYPRDALTELHTADRWLREGREVKEEELSQPYKVAKRRGVKETPNAPQEDAEALQEEPVVPVSDAMVTKMYGVWQTQAWVAPTAVGGVVPKNDRGNVHCPPFASELPKGTVHLQMPRLAPICRKLQVDFAPAMTGFDMKGGRSVPIIDGVVVCKEDEASVLEAYLEEERLREERAAQRRLAEADVAWRQLLRSIWTKLRLHQDYGDDAASAAGQTHGSYGLAVAEREDLSGPSDAAEPVAEGRELHEAVEYSRGNVGTDDDQAASIPDLVTANGESRHARNKARAVDNKSNMSVDDYSKTSNVSGKKASEAEDERTQLGVEVEEI